MKYDGVIFDLDGTLLDTLEDLSDSVNYALGSKGYPLRTLEEIRTFVGNGIGNLIDLSVPEKTDRADREEVLSTFKEHYGKNSRNKTAPYPGVMEMLKELYKEKVPVAVVSNKADFAVQTLVRDYFGELVGVAVGELQGVARKPAPDTTLIAMERSGCSRPIYVGDSEVDVQTAKNAGLDGIFVTWGFRTEKQLREAGALETVHDTDQLLRRIK